MPTRNPLYPPMPWPIERLAEHPAFLMLSKTDPNDQHDEKQLFYSLARLADRVSAQPPRYAGGIALLDFIGECSTQREAESLIRQLDRMNVFRVDVLNGSARLMPCVKIEGETIERTKMKCATYWLPVRLVAGLSREAAARHMSASKLVAAALLAYGIEAV